MPKRQVIKKSNKEKKTDKKKTPFNLKEWIKCVIDRSVNKRKSIPKIDAPFKLVVVQCEKGKGKEVKKVFSKFDSKINLFLFGLQMSSEDLKILSLPSNEVEIVINFVLAEFVNDSFMEKVTSMLKEEGVQDFSVLVLSPSSADLNLIYQLKKEI